MSEFSDQYFHDLAPRQRRYDTPVSDQLHFCVFPNGVKSWVFLYEVDGHLRRRTIGLFPDMGYQEALRGLDANRRIAEVDASEQRQPAARPSMSLTLTMPPAVQRVLRRISLTDVLTAAGTAVVALAVLMFIGRPDEPPTPEPTPAPVARTEPPTAQPSPAQPSPAQPSPAQPSPAQPSPARPSPAESRAAESRPAETGPAEPGPAEPQSVAPGSADAGGVAASTPAAARPDLAPPAAADPTRGAIRMAPPAPAEQDPDPITAFEDDLTRADGSPAPDPDATDLEAEIATSGPVEDLTLEELEERGMTGTAAAVSADDAAAREQLLAAENEAAASGPAEPVADSGATAEPVADSGAAAEPVAGAGAAAVAGQDVGAPAPDNPLANNAAAADPPADRDADELTVRRALLAGDVINGEPRNTLSGTVTVPAGGELLIYFYIEFAESIGQPVTHRWMNGGEVEEESAMQIDSAAGARVYTARLIGADRVGEWRVEAFTADGRLLRGLDFTVVAAEEEAAAATLADEPPAAPDL